MRQKGKLPFYRSRYFALTLTFFPYICHSIGSRHERDEKGSRCESGAIPVAVNSFRIAENSLEQSATVGHGLWEGVPGRVSQKTCQLNFINSMLSGERQRR
jgi:hypothetical protein